jgi:hypothetical protein
MLNYRMVNLTLFHWVFVICRMLWKFLEEAKSQDDAKEDDNGSFRQSREPRRMETDEAWQDGMMG